ncbi:MAG: hypothetical protein Q9M92_02845 [Enterobacterales bacterium]|nr:hypothetical protein [Enterobacterales bacterium]
MKANPSQRYLAIRYGQMLAIGAFHSAAALSSEIKYNSTGMWPAFAAVSAYLNGVKAPKSPLEFLPTFEKTFIYTTSPDIIVSVIKQTIQQEKSDVLQAYLTGVEDFPIEVETSSGSMGLMVLQYYANKPTLSRQTANRLFDDLNRYKQQYPESFRYWGLVAPYFYSAFYAGNLDKVAEILENDFPVDFRYWTLRYKFTEFVLQGWKDDPNVIELLARIEKDQARARKKFGLQ